jgi:hypothetical protein
LQLRAKKVFLRSAFARTLRRTGWRTRGRLVGAEWARTARSSRLQQGVFPVR